MHLFLRRTLLFCVAFLVVFSLMYTSYADTATLTYERLWPLKARLTGPDGYNFQVPSNKKFLDGEIAFCLEPLLEVVNGGTYTAQNQFPGLSAATVDKLERIVYLAWESSAKEAEDYFATSLLIWEALGYQVTSTTGFEVNSYSQRRAALAEADRMLLQLPSFHAQHVQLKLGESLTLSDENRVFSDMHTAGSTQPSAVEYTRTGDDLTLTALKAGSDTLSFQKVDDSYVGTSIFWETPTAGKQNLATLKLRTSIQASVQVSVTEPTGTITVTKVDECGNKLSQVEIALLDSAGNKLAVGRTDENGQVSFGERVYGNYFIQESQALPGYVFDPSKHALHLQEPQASLTLTNQPIRVRIEKRDRLTDAPLAGAVLELHRDGEAVSAWTSTEQAFTIRALPAGTYQVIEKDAPQSHLLMAPLEITVEERPEEQSILVYNEAVCGKIRVLKRDSVSGIALSGAVLSLFRSDGTLMDEKISDAEGVVYFEGLMAGTYYYIEKQAPDGYEPDPEEHPFQIGRDSAQLEHVLDNDRIYGHPQITKFDISTKEPLPDTLIAIYSAGGELVEEKRTDAQGQAVFAPLPAGAYYFLEREAPQGYQLNPDKQHFTISEQGQVFKALLEDERILVSPKVRKVDIRTQAPLAGAKIALYAEDGTLLEEQVTDDSGDATFTALPVGSYYFLEREAPEGYSLHPDKQPFLIEAQGQVVQITLSNEGIEGELLVRKIDATTKLPLAGAVWEVRREDQVLATLTSDHEGWAALKLPYGQYELREVKAPEGYMLSGFIQTFAIRTPDEKLEFVVENTRKTAKLPHTGLSYGSFYLGTISLALGIMMHRKRQ